MSNEVTMESERRSEETTSMNNSTGDRVNTPTMDFDDWVEDPFALAKEGDVFSSFTSDVEVANSSSNDTSPSNFASEKGVVPEKDSKAPDKNISNAAKKKADLKASERCRRFSPSLTEITSCIGATGGVTSKITMPAKKKSDYIPISRRKKKPKGMPKRPLSAYNLYFQAERTKIIAKQEEGKPRIGFEGLGKIIGKQWRDLSATEKKEYGKLAEKDSERYRKEMDAYHVMKAKRFAEEDRRAEEQSPVVSKLGSCHSVQASSFDPSFAKQQGSLRVVPVGEVFGSSVLVSHPPDSMVSSIPPGATSVSYRPIRIEQAPSPPRRAPTYSSISDPHYSQGDPPSHYFPQPPGARTSEPLPYEAVAPPPGATILSPHNNNCPMPPGMEVVLADRNGIDRKYSVQYTCYSMTRENANKYIDSIAKGNSNTATLRPWPQPPPSTGSSREYGEQWGV